MKKNILSFALLLLLAGSAVSCYEEFITDATHPNMGFALRRQVRTVIESKNSIYVGVAIGGKREVDLSDWAKFEIDETLLSTTNRTLLPSNYYKLADPETFRVRRTGMAVADVEITFTDDFYADPVSLTGDYILPFRLTSVSIPSVPDSTGYFNPNGAIRQNAETALVAIKYINEYSGTWYKMGTVTETDASGNAIGAEVAYGDTRDIINCQTVELTTTGRHSLSRSGLANTVSGSMQLVIDRPGEDVSSLTVSGEGISDATATLRRTGKYTFYSGTEPCPEIELTYRWTNGDKYYKVSELLVLRMWAERTLRIEIF